MTNLLYFVHQIVLKNLQIILIQNIKLFKFSFEKESNNSQPFRYILISRLKNGFKTPVYHETTFSELCSSFNSFIYNQYKIGLVFTLLFRTLLFVSDFFRFHMEISYLKNILRKNTFPIKLADNCIKLF